MSGASQGGMPQTLAPQGNFDVNQAAAGGLQQAMLGTQREMNYQPQQIQATGYRPMMGQAQGYTAMTGQAQGYDAATGQAQGYTAERVAGVGPIQSQNVQAGQIAGKDLSAYTNPYETQVVNQALGDIERSRQMAQNQTGAAATQAGAFGGSRHGIAEAETNRNFAQQAAQTASGLRQAGFQNAQQLAGQDISNKMQADLSNQSANLQAQTSTAANTMQTQQLNQAAGNTAGQFLAGAQNAMTNQNMNALNQARQFGAGAQNAMTGQNMSAVNAASQFGAGAQNAMTNQNMNAFNNAAQFGAQNQMTAQTQNAANQLAGSQQRLNASNQMANLGNQAFNTGRTINSDMLQQGGMIQDLNQQIINAGKGQYQGFTGAPADAMNNLLTALGGQPNQSSTTKKQNAGPLQFLQAAAAVPTGGK